MAASNNDRVTRSIRGSGSAGRSGRSWLWRFGLLHLLGSFLLLPSSGGWCQEEDAEENNSWLGRFSGQNRSTLRFRSVEGDEDFDFYDYWTLEGKGFFSDTVDLYFSGRVHKDLDSNSVSFADDLFTSVEDRDESWEDQIYQLYADLHDEDRTVGLRLVDNMSRKRAGSRWMAPGFGCSRRRRGAPRPSSGAW